MRILIQAPIDMDGIVDFPIAIAQKFIGINDIAIFSPTIFVQESDIDNHTVLARVLSIAKTLYEQPKLIPLPESELEIYIGIAPKNLEFDENIVYKKDILATQEDFLKFSADSDIMNYEDTIGKYIYHSSDGKTFIDDINRIVEYIILLKGSYGKA